VYEALSDLVAGVSGGRLDDRCDVMMGVGVIRVRFLETHSTEQSVCLPTCTDLYIYIHVYIHTFIFLYIHIYTYIHTYIHMQINLYIYI
jgi:hypothetical protein